MSTTKYILEKIKLEGVLHDLIVKSDAENVACTYNGAQTTLADALAEICASVAGLPTSDGVAAKIGAAIDELIGGAPETYNTLKEIADYIEHHESAAGALTAAIGNKVDKEDGKGLSANDFTDALKAKLESLPASIAEATADSAGLLSAADKRRLDGMRGVRSGTEVPADMQEGELFVRVVSA